MKRFFKTITGKTTLFITCVILICTLIAGLIGIVFMAETDVYTRPQAEVFDEYIDSRVRQDSYQLFLNVMHSREENETLTVPDEDIIFEICDSQDNLIVSSEGAAKVQEWYQTYEFGAYRDGEGNLYYDSHGYGGEEEVYTFKAYLTDAYRETDRFRFISRIVSFAYQMRYLIYPVMLVCLLLLVYAFVTLMSVSGRRNEEGLYPGPLNKVPFDLLLAATGVIVVLGIMFLDNNRFWDDLFTIIVVIAGTVVCIGLCLGLCMSLACRIKQKNVITGSFTYLFLKKCVIIVVYFLKLLKRLATLIWNLIKEIPLVWKTVLFLALTYILELFLYFEADALLLIERAILAVLVLFIVIQMRRLQKGGEALAQGDLQYRVDTKGMIFDLKKHGEDLNSISSGMAIAVEDRLKSERMKTELITNVSHDIKTPLTSIINYADLIGKEKSATKKTREYADVLTKQANRLKRLLDDLVEASKASTGNLEVDLLPCDASTFVTQAIGEYDEKLQQSDLTLITSVSEKQLTIMADGRRMWRIFDNLMNNICKYALSGTRVYLSLEEIDHNAVFTFKNTSRDALNISEEELMERFTRGDKSRNTEGNGLGLSIARSMAELQNGELKLQIDGDLFKAILSFPLI
ncbi:MAG: sensor histidine kinase [Erysipelotrichaceae bacterium]|nr:sensor histidine kinase [Erysipelotrichaceae bacterium]